MTEQYVSEVVAIGERDKKVVLEFEKPTKWAAFDPATAKKIGMEMARVSYEIDTGQKQEISGAKVLTEQLETTLQNRLTHIIRSMSEKGKAPGFIARDCLAVILREVY